MNTLYYQKLYKYHKVRAFKLDFNSSFTTSPYFKLMVLTNLINLLHSPPYFEYQFVMKTLHYPIRYSVSTILSNLMFLRMYLLVRIFTTQSSPWSELESEEACEKEGFQAGFFYTIKALMKQRPYASIMLNFTISVVVFGF